MQGGALFLQCVEVILPVLQGAGQDAHEVAADDNIICGAGEGGDLRGGFDAEAGDGFFVERFQAAEGVQLAGGYLGVGAGDAAPEGAVHGGVCGAGAQGLDALLLVGGAALGVGAARGVGAAPAAQLDDGYRVDAVGGAGGGEALVVLDGEIGDDDPCTPAAWARATKAAMPMR